MVFFSPICSQLGYVPLHMEVMVSSPAYQQQFFLVFSIYIIKVLVTSKRHWAHLLWGKTL